MLEPGQPVHAAVRTAIGWITVQCDGRAISGLGFAGARPALAGEARPEAAAAAEAVQRFLDLRGLVPERPALRLIGTPFQRRVWAVLQQIPPGVTRTYGELARRLGTSPRAVGGACRANPVPLFVPCHRVVTAGGGAGGFAGHGSGRWPQIKRWLLDREGVELVP